MSQSVVAARSGADPQFRSRSGAARRGAATPEVRPVGRRRRMPLASLFMPPDCVGCSQPGAVLCRRCRFGLLATSAVVVEPASGPHGAAEAVYAAAPFAGTVRDIVTGLKYRNRRDAARVLARLIVERIDLGRADLVTWAPTTDQRARRRGFDQAEALAREVARLLGVPCRRLLFRRPGAAQTGRTRAERQAVADTGAFRGRSAGAGLRVVVVDDVVTTGSTLRAARESLWAAGVADVVCVAAASTPSGPRGRAGLTFSEGRHR